MKKRFKTVVAALFAVAVLFVTVPHVYANDSPFVDVKPDFWAYDAIVEAYNDGVMTGTGITESGGKIFTSSGKLNMAQFVTVLTRAFYNEEVMNSLQPNTWPNRNYDAAEKHNLFTGLKRYSSGVEVTREVMAQMMYNVMVDKGILLPNETEIQMTMNKIPDLSSVDSDFKTAVAVCYYLDLLSGVDAQGTFAPKGVLNRAQTAVIYTRLKKAISVLGTGMPGTTNPGTTNPGTTDPGTSDPGTTQNPSGAILTNREPVTEENVLALIEEYQNGKEPGEKAKAAGFTSYADRSTYDAYDPKYRIVLPSGPINGIECGKFAYAFFDEIFGEDAPIREVTNPADVRPGDLIHFSGHWAIATAKATYYDFRNCYVTMTVGGGPTGLISWGNGQTPLKDIDKIYTRYSD